ncbi:MAG: hypothetical protein WD489_03295 [Rhodovibrionaceae bacterium]
MSDSRKSESPKLEKRFGVIPGARRVWAVASVHGEAERLKKLHGKLLAKLRDGDRIVYLGNLFGRGADVRGAVDELLGFRCEAMAREPAEEPHVILLRGSQEEMWQKLLQLQFATDPRSVLAWMVDQGVGPTLKAYGSSPEDALAEGRRGAMELTRWTGALRAAMQKAPGHYELMSALRRAAYTDDNQLLFVNCGLDPSRPLEAQTDSFWWDSNRFGRISAQYGSFKRIVRGFDLMHPGLVETAHTLTIDGGCGFGGPLLAACLRPSGEVEELLEA